MLTICDSICVKILKENLILAAKGNELSLYGNDGYRETLPFKLASKIHGIDYTGGNKILVYGEKEFLYISFIKNKCDLVARYEISDWISCGKLLCDGNKICLITGHSVALELEYIAEKQIFRVTEKSSCEDKSTLYCSHLVGDVWNDLVVFGGNAFGEILIWKPSSQKNANVDNRIVLDHRISAHQGVLFSIHVDVRFKLVVTTSDDRSIRFWDVNMSELSLTPFKSGYGHTARVFQAKIIQEADEPYVISVGEDSNICLWNRCGELMFKRRHHFGATIWNFDYDEHTKTLFSSGSDGNIFKYGFELAFRSPISTEVVSTTLGVEYLSKVKFLPKNCLIGLTNRNNLVFRDILGDWEKVNEFSCYKCTVLQVYGNLVALAGYQVVSLFQFDSSTKQLTRIFEGKLFKDIIRSVCFLSESEFLICSESGECKVFLDKNFETYVSVEIPQSKEKWITTALKNNEYLICSNRQGNLFMYYLENGEFLLKSVLKHVHGNLAAMSIILTENCDDYFFVKTCGHDSTVKEISIDKHSKTMLICSKQSVPVSWIERIHTLSNQEFLLGFNDNHFVLWEKNNDVIFEISCGGGHRCWDAEFNVEANQVSVIFIKNKVLYKYTSPLENKSSNMIDIPRNSWHIRPCNILTALPIDGTDSILLFSGGEENLLKISKYNSELSQQAEISSHISSIKALKITKNASTGKYLVFSTGGRAQLCISEFDVNTKKVVEIFNFMLKSNDYDRKFRRNTQEVDFDPETRFMSLDYLVSSPNTYDIFIGCSDGYIRRFQYSRASNDMKLLSMCFYNRCILHVRLILNHLVTASTDGKICVWSIEDFSKPIFELCHHESGINSFDIANRNGVLHVLTGGDDQAVVYSKVEHNFSKAETKHFYDLHTAQVTGVKLTTKCDSFYSVGIDQCLNRIDLDTLKLIGTFYSCVSDVKGIDIIPLTEERNISIIYGCGIQIIDNL